MIKPSDLVPRKTYTRFRGLTMDLNIKDSYVSSDVFLADYQALSQTIMGSFQAASGKGFGGKALHPGLLRTGTCHSMGVRAELLQAAGVRGHCLLEALQH